MLLHAMATEFPDDELIIICSEDSLLWPLGELANVHIVPFKSGISKEWSRFCLERFCISRIAYEYKADIIWTYNAGPYVRTGIPQVLMVCNSFQVYPWLVAKYHPRSRLTLAALRWFCRRSIRCCDAVQVETPVLVEYIRRISGVPERIEVIPKAVESSLDFEPQSLSIEHRRLFDGGLGNSAFTFLYVATCSPHKNQATVITAVERLRSQGISVRLALSASEEQLQRYCSAEQISSLTKSGHLLPLGWINKEQLAAIYAAADACVMPSHLEQLSSAHLEAMHWRKPQISADLPYAHDLCGNATLYADPDNPVDWASKMQTLMANTELQQSLVAAGIERMSVFPKSWREVAQRERAFLADVASRYKASHAKPHSH